MNANNLVDSLINFDTDYYLQRYPDLQYAIRSMQEVDRKLFLLNHFIKHGYAEKRKYRLRSVCPNCQSQSQSQQDKHTKVSKNISSKNRNFDKWNDIDNKSDDEDDDDLDYKEKDYESHQKINNEKSSNNNDDSPDYNVLKKLEEFRKKCKNDRANGGHRDKKGNFFVEIDG